MSVPKNIATTNPLGYTDPEGFTHCCSCAPKDAHEWDDWEAVRREEYEWPDGFACRDCGFTFFPAELP